MSRLKEMFGRSEPVDQKQLEAVFDPFKALDELGLGGAKAPVEIDLDEELASRELTECADCDEGPIRTVTEPVTIHTVSDNTGLSVAAMAGSLRDKYAAEREGIDDSKVGVRFNTGKARWDLLPEDSLAELVQVYTMGAEKYADRNWEKGLSMTGCFASMMRHAWAWMRGENTDPESGLHHMAHVAWNALAIVSFSKRGVGTDDRPNA